MAEAACARPTSRGGCIVVSGQGLGYQVPPHAITMYHVYGVWWTIGLEQTMLPTESTPKHSRPTQNPSGPPIAEVRWPLVHISNLRVQTQTWRLEDTSQEWMQAADWLPPSRAFEAQWPVILNLVHGLPIVGSHPVQSRGDVPQRADQVADGREGRIRGENLEILTKRRRIYLTF